MLSKEKIRQVLHASRVVPLSVAKPHGPLGLEQLAAAVSRINPEISSGTSGVCRPVALDHEIWDKLDQLAATTSQTIAQRVTASQVAAAIIEQFVMALPQQDET
jgi:hypothetical protein